MTLFRKIYKQANDDIKPSEDMINRVILNAHKGAEKRQSPPPYRRYAKYAVSAAAAVAVVSAAVISMPYWQKTRDDGVIIEEQVSTPTPSDMSESVVSNTADTSYPYPTDSPQTIQNPYTPPPNNYSDSQTKTEKKSGDYNSSDNEKVAVHNRIANENKSLKIEDKTKIPNIESEQNSENQEITEDVTVEESAIEENALELSTIFSAFMSSDRTAEISTKKEVPTEITSDEGNADTVIGTGMAMNSTMATSVPTPQIEINTPSGFETTDTYNGGAAFESENGGRIDVNYYYSGNDDTEPVYNEYENDVSAYFTEDKIDYNIYGTDTGREPVEEVVNSIK